MHKCKELSEAEITIQWQAPSTGRPFLDVCGILIDRTSLSFQHSRIVQLGCHIRSISDSEIESGAPISCKVVAPFASSAMAVAAAMLFTDSCIQTFTCIVLWVHYDTYKDTVLIREVSFIQSAPYREIILCCNHWISWRGVYGCI